MAQGSTSIGTRPTPIAPPGTRSGLWVHNAGAVAVWVAGFDGRAMEAGDGVLLDPGERELVRTADALWGVTADDDGLVGWSEV